jgi:hypothetical protein
MGITNRVPLPGVVGRMDHMTVDNKHGRVIVAALGNNTVEVVAGFSLRDIHTIPGQDGPQGALTFRTSTSFLSPTKVGRSTSMAEKNTNLSRRSNSTTAPITYAMTRPKS